MTLTEYCELLDLDGLAWFQRARLDADQARRRAELSLRHLLLTEERQQELGEELWAMGHPVAAE